jgi:hypothetical protein
MLFRPRPRGAARGRRTLSARYRDRALILCPSGRKISQKELDFGSEQSGIRSGGVIRLQAVWLKGSTNGCSNSIILSVGGA